LCYQIEPAKGRPAGRPTKRGVTDPTNPGKRALIAHGPGLLARHFQQAGGPAPDSGSPRPPAHLYRLTKSTAEQLAGAKAKKRPKPSSKQLAQLARAGGQTNFGQMETKLGAERALDLI